MTRPKRIYSDASQYYFVTSKTYQNAKVFTETRIIRVLLDSLEYLQGKHYIKLFAWVVLPDHIHLLLEIIGGKNVSQVMHD
ncbi:MAG: transposase, partial [Parcubacteria group bacterium]